jgi:hypothetical protein
MAQTERLPAKLRSRSGNTDTKPSWLDSIKSGRTKDKAVNCSDRKMRLFGDVALITACRLRHVRFAPKTIAGKRTAGSTTASS